MKRNKLNNLISILLVMAMIIQVIPANAITVMQAENVLVEETIENQKSNISEEMSTEGNPSSEIVGEIESLRDENNKHFRLEDGSYIAVSYSVPVHYKDESGNWEDIDNSLELKKDSTGDMVYRSNNAINSASFSADLQEGKLVTSTVEDVSVTMRLLDNEHKAQISSKKSIERAAISDVLSDDDTLVEYNRYTKADIVEDSKASLLSIGETVQQKNESFELKNLESTILYSDVYPDVDLMYTAYSSNIKEQIIVKEPQNTYQYTFMLELDGLRAVLNDDGSISLINNANTPIYHIPAPFMQDASGAYSEAVDYMIAEVENGAILTVIADETWINAEERTFPVTIDPTLVKVADDAMVDADSSIYATYVTEGSPSTNHTNHATLYLGYGANSSVKSEYGYMHFNKLPSVPAGSIVINANLNMFMFDYSQVGCNEIPFSICEVTENKPTSYGNYYDWIRYLTWNSKPDFDTTNEIDYTFASDSKENEYLSWEITELVKKWYLENTENRTIAIVPSKGDTYTSSKCAVAAFKAYNQTIAPGLVVHYRSNVGIEPYYTYNTLSLGNTGAAYISNESGQVKIATPLVGYFSTTNPVSINLFYNSDYFVSSASTSYKPPIKSGLNMTVGHGWTLDIIQKMEDVTISGTAYKKYTDGDGTVHYFLKKSDDTTYFYDEDGLGLKVKETDSNDYTMSDDHGNIWKFENNFLTEISDSDNNKILIDYSGSKIEQVRQKNNNNGAIIVATFEYSNNDALTKVIDVAGNIYLLDYSSETGNLTAIKRNETTISRFRYNSHRLMRAVDGESNYAIDFDYSNGKISFYQEVIGADSNNTTGAKVSVRYPNHSKTVYRDYGADRESNTSDDLLTYYLFDYWGRTVNAYTTDKSGNIVGATNSAYSGIGTTKKRNNRTLCTASIGTAGFSLLRNSSVESTDNYQWTVTNTVVTTTKARTGVRSIKGTLGDYTQSALRQTLELTQGTAYTFSAYVNTKDVTNFTGDGVYLRVRDRDEDTNWYSQPINYKTSSDIDNGWVRISVSFEAESTDNYVVGVFCDGGTGTFYADDFQLEKGTAASNCNLVENGDFEMSTHGWELSDSAQLYNNVGVGGSENSIKITSTPFNTTTARAHQDIKINLPATETYVVSGWVLANSVPDNTGEDSDTKKCGIKTAVYYTDGEKDVFYVPFNSNISDWQFVSKTIVPKSPEKTVQRIRIICLYGGNANRAYFDKISLVREAAQTMNYDDDGNLKSVTTTGLDKDVNTFEGGNLIKSVTSGYGTYDYTYYGDYPHRVKTIEGYYLTQTMTYDDQGNVLTSSIKDNDAETSLKLISGAEYSGSGNLQTKYTDTNVISTTYSYSSDNSIMYGIPTSISNEKGVTTYQEIDADSRITTAYIPSVSRLRYAYSDGKLSKITRINTPDSKKMDYLFNYDAFGNTSKISIGGRTLATYKYGANNGLLSRLTYGAIDPNNTSLNDAFSIDYTYDKFGRTNKVYYPNGQQLRYTYDGDGNISRIKENGGSSVIFNYFNYDTLGRLLTNRIVKGTSLFMQVGNEYNSKNQLVGQNWLLKSSNNAKSYSTAYTYNPADGLPRTMTTATGETINIGYDALRRLRKLTVGKVTRTYNYRTNSNTRATNQIESIEYKDLTVPLKYSYTYDSVGNITTISDPIDGEKKYTYDSLGQMLSETIDGTKYTYTYDNVGNILTSKNSTGQHTYTYSEGSWGDLLKYYDGVELLYDRIGNPTQYYNGTNWNFTWKNGRKLATATSGSTNISYDYDMTTGMRQSKTVGSKKYEYYYSGDKLMRMTISDGTVMDFFYNHLGQPYAIDYNGEMYYYILNQQGDVVRLVSSTGTSYGSYKYDAWGNILYSTNGNLINNNPLRYRGYVYDNETGLYYVSSRYYDPEIGRFLNADNNFSNYNLFMYCGNNPVNRIDPNGEHWYYLWIDDLIEAVDELMASVSNIVYERAAYERSYYDPKGANDLWNSRPFQDTKPSQEMQIFTEFMYDHDFVADISVSASIPKTEINVKVGVSKVLSPNKNIDASYVHTGIGASTPSVLPINISYSVGIVNGVNAKENYAKHFLDIGAGAIYGFDYCWWPNGASAYSFTIGTSYGVYGGYDYYWCLD